jgi:flagellar hook assembly protein FlgD
MLKRLSLAALAASVVASAASAQTPQLLMPGVTYDRQVTYTLEGRVVTNVITTPKPGGLYSLAPSLAAYTIQGRGKLTQLERRLSASATVAGVTGDVFPAGKGSPGLLEQNGVLQGFPDPQRSSLGISAAGNLFVHEVPFTADWRGSGILQPLRGLNRPPRPGWVTLYTNQWGPTTPRQKGVLEAVLHPFPAATPGADLTGTVIRLTSGGGTPIPNNGAVLSARGGGRAKLNTDARPRTVVTVRLMFRDNFAAIPQAMGGGPVLVRNGQTVFNAGESFEPLQLARRQPRAAVGQRADGSILLVSVDGSRPGYSVGVTNYELAQTMQHLGAVTAIALGTGKRVSLAFDGNLLSRPAAGERSVSTALLLSYTGAEAPPPSAPVLSPNGDGVGDLEQLAYKVVRDSHVTATLVGPQGASLPVVTDKETSRGTYPIRWDGTDGDGTLEPEGQWAWKVTAVDSRGTSQASQTFSLNTTLKGLHVAPAGTGTFPLAIGLSLLHPATLTVQVETRGGALIKVLRTTEAPAAAFSFTWNGKVKGERRLPKGRYQIRATAVNSIGTMDLVAPFRVG